MHLAGIVSLQKLASIHSFYLLFCDPAFMLCQTFWHETLFSLVITLYSNH
jgi:hypothetical protein